MKIEAYYGVALEIIASSVRSPYPKIKRKLCQTTRYRLKGLAQARRWVRPRTTRTCVPTRRITVAWNGVVHELRAGRNEEEEERNEEDDEA